MLILILVFELHLLISHMDYLHNVSVWWFVKINADNNRPRFVCMSSYVVRSVPLQERSWCRTASCCSWAASPCSTWSWPSDSSTGRAPSPVGAGSFLCSRVSLGQLDFHNQSFNSSCQKVSDVAKCEVESGPAALIGCFL